MAFQGKYVHSFAKTYQTSSKVSFPILKTTTADVAEGQQGDSEDIENIKKGLTKEFFSIGVPAFVQLAAEPLAALVDTAYLGRLGPEVNIYASFHVGK